MAKCHKNHEIPSKNSCPDMTGATRWWIEENLQGQLSHHLHFDFQNEVGGHIVQHSQRCNSIADSLNVIMTRFCASSHHFQHFLPGKYVVLVQEQGQIRVIR